MVMLYWVKKLICSKTEVTAFQLSHQVSLWYSAGACSFVGLSYDAPSMIDEGEITTGQRVVAGLCVVVLFARLYAGVWAIYHQVLSPTRYEINQREMICKLGIHL